MNDRAEYYKACVAQWVHLYKDESLEKILSDMEDDELLKSPYDEDFAQIVGMAKRLRELTRWIPVSERLPTIEDADARGLVEWKHNVFYGGTEIRKFDQPTHYHERLWYTHWRKIDAPNLG